MKENLSGTLAIDLGNTNTVIAFQDQKDINSVLVEIPNIITLVFMLNLGLISKLKLNFFINLICLIMII